MEDIPIPMKFLDDKIEFAIVLFSGGKISAANEYAIGSIVELMAPWRNLKVHRSSKVGVAPLPIYNTLNIDIAETSIHLRLPLLVKEPINSPERAYGRVLHRPTRRP